MASFPFTRSLVTAAVVAVTFAVRAGLPDDSNFRPDVLSCEDAVAHLAECCPQFDPHAVQCFYSFQVLSGCGDDLSTDQVAPALSPDESACIRAMSCDALRNSTVCARAQKATPYVDHQRPGYEPEVPDQSHAAVCP
jgi:hypothetical protein